MQDEARLEENETGLAPATQGWFVVNARDAAWLGNDAFGAACVFEGPEVSFAELGFRLCVLEPGQANALYHRESAEEDFLVLAGRCTLLIAGEERQLGAWDFVHCPPNTDHVFVGSGDGPCVILMVGARHERRTLFYPDSELARRHNAGSDTETASAKEAYSAFPEWRLERPAATGLPWSDLGRNAE